MIVISTAKQQKQDKNLQREEANATSILPDRNFSTADVPSTSLREVLPGFVAHSSPELFPDINARSLLGRYYSPSTSLSSQSSVDKSKGLGHAALVVEVRGENGQLTKANEVTGVANDESLGLGEVGDTTAVLETLGVAVSHGGDDLVLDRLGHVFDGAVDEGCALAVLVLLVMDAKEGGK